MIGVLEKPNIPVPYLGKFTAQTTIAKEDKFR